eukprot:gnl/TRDRNA2_/TRDRNA2_198760_c0_seq1.p1 gnl/TRDRNA2_/TRDRNA2_198760_c0~~gnl/TRDRNA2_/TRDRNA2_198760_c0_seq1.p1  ORF type:complete len:264 (-),score=23.80 gnl/TRDRNA2_/TRDRNA2_198760_c0_seq1:45-836(-)
MAFPTSGDNEQDSKSSELIQVIPRPGAYIFWPSIWIPDVPELETAAEPWYTYCLKSPDVYYLCVGMNYCWIAAGAGVLIAVIIAMACVLFDIKILVPVAFIIIMFDGVVHATILTIRKRLAFRRIRDEVDNLAGRVHEALSIRGFQVEAGSLVLKSDVYTNCLPEGFERNDYRLYFWLKVTKPSDEFDLESLVPASTVIGASASGEGDEDPCIICLQNFCEGEQIRSAQCSHRFHAACVDEWFRRSRMCPVCKQSLVANGSSG